MEIRRQIYSGSIIVFRSMPPMVEMCEIFRNRYMQNDHLSGTTREAIMQFEDDSEVRQLWRSIILSTGVHGESLMSAMWDRVRLRIQNPGAYYDNISDVTNSRGRFSSSLPIHRDTWASNVMQQLNWWAPLLPLSAEATLGLYPSHFTVSVPNTSREWDFKELKQKRAQLIPYPQLPILQDQLMNPLARQRLQTDLMPILIEPGDVLVFSGAQLHGSIVKEGAREMRYSTEVRTVEKRDIENDRGAVNVDGGAKGWQLQWFADIPLCDSVHSDSARPMSTGESKRVTFDLLNPS